MTIPGGDQTAERAELLPEEIAAGSDDPSAQAEAILTESKERTAGVAPQESNQPERRTEQEATGGATA